MLGGGGEAGMQQVGIGSWSRTDTRFIARTLLPWPQVATRPRGGIDDDGPKPVVGAPAGRWLRDVMTGKDGRCAADCSRRDPSSSHPGLSVTG
jgi:hypothetical protein